MKNLRVYGFVFSLLGTATVLFFYWKADSEQNKAGERLISRNSVIFPQENTVEPVLVESVEKIETKREQTEAEDSKTGFDGLTGQWLTAIEGSYRVNDLMLKAAVLRDQYESEALLNEAYNRYPSNTVLNYQILQFCLSHKSSTLCTLPVVDTLLKVDGDNMHTMVGVALFQYNFGNPDAALELLVKAMDTSSAEDYLVRYLEVVDESFAQHEFVRDSDSFSEYFGIMPFARFNTYTEIFSMCDIQAVSGNSRWSRACSNIGKVMVERSALLVDQRFGLSIQMKYSGLSEDEIKTYREPIDKKYEEDSKTFANLTKRIYSPRESKEKISDDEWETVLDTYRQEGEWAALLYLEQIFSNGSE